MVPYAINCIIIDGIPIHPYSGDRINATIYIIAETRVSTLLDKKYPITFNNTATNNATKEGAMNKAITPNPIAVSGSGLELIISDIIMN